MIFLYSKWKMHFFPYVQKISFRSGRSSPFALLFIPLTAECLENDFVLLSTTARLHIPERPDEKYSIPKNPEEIPFIRFLSFDKSAVRSTACRSFDRRLPDLQIHITDASLKGVRYPLGRLVVIVDDLLINFATYGEVQRVHYSVCSLYAPIVV